MKIDSVKRSLQVKPQGLNWTLVFVSFLKRYPSDTDNQIYSNSEIRIWNPILLVLILCTASFQIWTSPCVHHVFTMCSSMLCALSFHSNSENFEFRWSITGGLYLLYCPFCYLQNVDFEGFHKNGFESSCSDYRHYLSDYQLSSIQLSWVTYWLP